jgi:hypothetical protein
MNSNEIMDFEFWLKQWLAKYRIDVNSDCNRWRAVAYDTKGDVIEFASADSKRQAIEALCVEIGLVSFWEMPSCPRCGEGGLHSTGDSIC